MNVMHLKPPPGRHHKSAAEALASWHELGQQWIAWPGVDRVTIKDEFRMRLAGFTHVRFVWWDGERVQFAMKELK